MVLTSGKVRCAPSSPCSRRSGRCAWLRAAVLLSSPALRATARALSGRDGKAGALTEPESGLGRGRLDDGVAFRVERDRRDRRPVPGLTAPAPWVALAYILADRHPPHQRQIVRVTGVGW